MAEHIYLDWNSCGIIAPCVLDVMSYAWTNYSNPLSKHSLGQKSRRYLDELTSRLLYSLNASSYEIMFTSGASEANLHVLNMYTNVYVSDVEHPSVRACPHATTIPVDGDGQMKLEVLESHLQKTDRPFLVSYMIANHETGIVNDVSAVAAMAKKYGGYVHSDAVQAFGRYDLDLDRLGIDYMTIAPHKCGGPIGIGASVYKGPMKKVGWSRQTRMGTPPIPLIAGMVESYNLPRVGNSTLERGLRSDQIVGSHMARLPNTTCIRCNNKSELMMALDMHKIYVSSGAACTSGASDMAHSPLAMGIDDGTIRISSGHSTSEADLSRCLSVLREFL